MHNTHLFRLTRRHRRSNLGQTLAKKQDTIDEHPIGGTIDLKVPE